MGRHRTAAGRNTRTSDSSQVELLVLPILLFYVAPGGGKQAYGTPSPLPSLLRVPLPPPRASAGKFGVVRCFPPPCSFSCRGCWSLRRGKGGESLGLLLRSLLSHPNSHARWRRREQGRFSKKKEAAAAPLKGKNSQSHVFLPSVCAGRKMSFPSSISSTLRR